MQQVLALRPVEVLKNQHSKPQARLTSNSQANERQRAQETTAEREARLAAEAQSKHHRRSFLTREQKQHQYTLNNEQSTLQQNQAIRSEAISFNESIIKHYCGPTNVCCF